jgi:CheY-like chemotaxis protein
MPDKKFRILCVDDHEDTCFMLSTLFGQIGYEVETSADPDDALRLAREGRFDLFIVDGRYQGVARPDLCDSILALNPSARIIFYSGMAQDSARAQSLCAGATAYVGKPDIKNLVAAVKEVLAASGDDVQTRSEPQTSR